MVDDASYLAWKRGLEDGDFAVADRVEEMPLPFAVAYLAVEIHRQNHMIEELRRAAAPWKRLLGTASLIAGGVAAGFFGSGAELPY